MNGRFLLDSNIVIPLMAGERSITRHVGQADAVFVASVTLGEIYFGARKSACVNENLAQVERYASDNTILAVDTETARLFGQIKNQLRERGRPIPENDIWIAAVAIQYGLTLVTRDDHFASVESLPTVRW